MFSTIPQRWAQCSRTNASGMKENTEYQLPIVKTALKTALVSLLGAPTQDCLAVAGADFPRGGSRPGTFLPRLLTLSISRPASQSTLPALAHSWGLSPQDSCPDVTPCSQPPAASPPCAGLKRWLSGTALSPPPFLPRLLL